MTNTIFNALNQNNMITQFNAFMRSFTGDPKQEVQKLLDSGRMSQEEFSRLSETANQMQSLLLGR